MNLIKSLFISLMPVWLLFVVFNGCLLWLNGRQQLLAVGVVLSAVPMLLFLAYILSLKKLARTSAYLPGVLLPSFMGYVLSLYAFLNNHQLEIMIAMMYALSAFMMTFLYVFWYSNNNRSLIMSIRDGHQLPLFDVKDTTGQIISSSQFSDQKSLIFFYRGNWCPLCMAQIDEVVKSYRMFNELGVQVIFIAPQSAKHTQKLANKYDLSFQFFIDENNRAAQKLGIIHKCGLPMGFQVLGYDTDSVYPTVIATDENGVIIYNDQTSNYRLRPEPEVLIEVFSVRDNSEPKAI